MLYLYIFLAITIIIIIYASFEAGWLEVKRVVFTKNKRCLKLIQLSDIHINLLRVSPEKIIQVIKQEKPDLIVITGDYIDKAAHIPAFLDFIDRVKGCSKIYACLGNHDYGAFLGNEAGLKKFMDAITLRGITLLHNSSEVFYKDSKAYNIIGIADMRYEKQDVKKALKSIDPNASINIAFTHNPDLVLEMPRGAVDYLLCGHFHGGQIWAPFGLEFRLLRSEKLCRMGIKRGLHKKNGINLYLNRGLGNVCVPLRFFSRPEITVFELP